MAPKRTTSTDSDEDETLYYRYPTTAAAPTPTSSSRPTGSGGLAPSKSTIYISNLPFSLTNSDIHTLLSSFGKIARVTILKDRDTRLSRGVAFVLFVSRQDAINAAKALDGKVMNGRTLKASIATDNGRAKEFIRKRVYRDKSRCYECGGSDGHLSYECPKNSLGIRERPKEKKKGWKGKGNEEEREVEVEEEEEGLFEEENWASVVDDGADKRLLMGGRGDGELGGGGVEETKKGKKVKKTSYFSDESGDEDD